MRFFLNIILFFAMIVPNGFGGTFSVYNSTRDSIDLFLSRDSGYNIKLSFEPKYFDALDFEDDVDATPITIPPLSGVTFYTITNYSGRGRPVFRVEGKSRRSEITLDHEIVRNGDDDISSFFVVQDASYRLSTDERYRSLTNLRLFLGADSVIIIGDDPVSHG